MLRLLGVNGMSSDESSVEEGVVHYRIFIKTWRHPAVTEWLRCFDAVYRKLRKNESGGKRQGAEAHWREVGTEVDDSRAAVPYLPRSAYNPTWFNRLSSFELANLHVSEAPYEFQHTPDIVA